MFDGVVAGTIGVGKSALLEAFIQELAGKNETNEVFVFRSRCYERESLPFKAVDPMVDAIGRHLSHVSPTLRSELLPEQFATVFELPVRCCLLRS